MGTEAIGYVLGQQCAPVIAGIKPSNLLIVEKGNQSRLTHMLKGTSLCGYLLYTSAEKDYWLLYEAKELERMLSDADKRAYLWESGYCAETLTLDRVLLHLAQSFRRYKEGEGEFPHEMGVFFGYPLGDVKGFIENKGQNFKLSGYWKVYDDVAYASRVFDLYEAARKKALELCSQGMRISDIWKSFRMADACITAAV
ncbi:MAG: DUF3793 family protein [Lachnospiraceae bacterium]|nr:DUF3793 family protein [Lachnospiraceae bacterium]